MSGPRVRISLGFGFALLALGALSTACTSERESSPVSKPRTTETLASTQPMNLVMIGLDTLRADHVGLYGYERPTTPNLDRFAEASVVFERTYSQASSTRPSHQSMFQSRPPSAAAANYLALAEVLLENGFRTAAFTGGGNISSRLGFARGFERYEERDTGLAGTLPMAAAWLREHRDERFFLFLHTYDIHLPYDPPEPYASMFSENYEGVVTGAETRSLLRRVRELDGFEGKSFDLETNDRERVVAL
ncbi:MAG: sulfatase-like hydrolase/transferase, partial [bacterium]